MLNCRGWQEGWADLTLVGVKMYELSKSTETNGNGLARLIFSSRY